MRPGVLSSIAIPDNDARRTLLSGRQHVEASAECTEWAAEWVCGVILIGGLVAGPENEDAAIYLSGSATLLAANLDSPIHLRCALHSPSHPHVKLIICLLSRQISSLNLHSVQLRLAAV